MREISYKNFSLRFHQKNRFINQFNVCQFELTFRCPLHCNHCYTECYNNRSQLKRELTTKEIFSILNKVYSSGVLWLCLTGGDPLIRDDFLNIYAYAREKGFIVTIFTSGVLITEKVAAYFKRFPPFCIEITLNGITKRTYEAISGVKGTFRKAMSSIRRLKKRDIPFKIKTQITRENIYQVDKIRRFVESLNLKFRPRAMLFARLNGDSTPCSLRIDPEEALYMGKDFKTDSVDEKEALKTANRCKKANKDLFWCAAGRDTFYIDPYGNMVLCSAVRAPSLNLLGHEIADGAKMFDRLISQRFKGDSKCKSCTLWYLCSRCPGRAYLEKKDAEAPLEYFCKLAHLMAKDNAQH